MQSFALLEDFVTALVEVELEKTAAEEDDGNANSDPSGRLSARTLLKHGRVVLTRESCGCGESASNSRIGAGWIT